MLLTSGNAVLNRHLFENSECVNTDTWSQLLENIVMSWNPEDKEQETWLIFYVGLKRMQQNLGCQRVLDIFTSSFRTPPWGWKASSSVRWSPTLLQPGVRGWYQETESWLLTESVCLDWTTRGKNDWSPNLSKNLIWITDFVFYISSSSLSLLVERSWSSHRVTDWGYWWPDLTGWLRLHRLNADSISHCFF